MVAFVSLPALIILAASIVTGLVVPRGGDPLAGRASAELGAHYDPLDCSNTHELGCTPSTPASVYVSGRSESACAEADEDDSENADDGDNSDEDNGDDGDDEVPQTNKGSVRITQSDPGVQTGGFATWYFQGGNAGACGEKHSDSEFIAALDSALYGDTGKRSRYCNRRIQITNTENNKQVTVTVKDACPTCRNSKSIDLSRGAFKQIATYDKGEVPIKWKFV